MVVADSRSPRDGRFIEILGHYDSTVEPAVIKIDEEKIFQKDEEKEYSLIPESFTLYLLVPGTFQLQSERLFKACSYFYSAIFFPVSWFVFLFLFFGQNSVTKYDKKPLYFFSLLVLIQLVMVYLINIKEVKSGINRS